MSHVVTTSLCAALLAGCGGAPQASDPPSPDPTTSATGTSSPPPLPSDAKADSRTSAGAFVEHYIDVLNYAMTTGDLDEARLLSDDSCESCSAMLDAVQEVYDAGGAVRGGTWTPKLVSAVAIERGWVIDAELQFAPQVLRRSESAPEERLPGGTGSASFTVKWDGSWRVTETTRAS